MKPSEVALKDLAWFWPSAFFAWQKPSEVALKDSRGNNQVPIYKYMERALRLRSLSPIFNPHTNRKVTA